MVYFLISKRKYMPKYIYKAKKSPTEIVQEVIEAETYNDAISKLSKMGYFPISVEEETAASRSGRIASLIKKKIRLSDLSVFTRQLSELLNAGVPLLQGLHVLSQQTENRELRLIIDDLSKTIQEGGTLSQGLARYPKVFSSLYVNITRSGELGGNLENSLNRLSSFIDKEEEMRSRIQQAVSYPALMSAVGFITIFVLVAIVIPRLAVMFENIGQTLPIPTLILIAISSTFAKYWWFIILAVGAIVFLLKRQARTREARLKLDKLKLELPMFGVLIKKIEIARLTRTLATLLDSGISILTAIDSVIRTIQNEVIKAELQKTRQDVKDGASLGKSLKDSSYLPPYVVNMVIVGEESGQLENVLLRIASSYEAQADKAIGLMMALLEPALILFMGVIIGFIVISMLLPIFQFNIMVR